LPPLKILALAREHPVSTDRVLTGIWTAASLVGLWLVTWPASTAYRPPDVGGVLLTLTIVVPLAWRRQRPGLVLLISGTALLGYDALGYRSGLAWLATFLAVYSYACHRRKRDSYWPLAVWLAEILAHLGLHSPDSTTQTVLAYLGATAFVWIRGDAVRSGLLANQREREARALQAVTDERSRIARELHDIVSQALGVIVMQAGGARSVPDLPPADAKAVLGTIEQTGRQAFAEMRRLVGVLREDESDGLEPQPTVSQIPALVDQLAAAGLAVDLEVHGDRRLTVPAGIELSAYRIVQEALTNTLKHASTGRAKVRLEWTADRLDVEVTDDGPASRGPAVGRPASAGGNGLAHPGSGGHGLVGMRERVMLFDGELEAGPVAGGYRVFARLPLGTT
jgi:signal transduction histidine kinase